MQAQDRPLNTYRLRVQYIEVSFNCTEEGRQAAMDRLINVHKVHFLLGGTRVTAMQETLQVGSAQTASLPKVCNPVHCGPCMLLVLGAGGGGVWLAGWPHARMSLK